MSFGAVGLLVGDHGAACGCDLAGQSVGSVRGGDAHPRMGALFAATLGVVTTSTGMPISKRLILIAAIVFVTVAPAVIMLVVTALVTGKTEGAATWASIPAVAGIAAVVGGGRRFAVIVAIVMAFLAPLAIVAGTSPVSGAALMALLAMTVGRMSRFGLHRSALLVPVMLAWPLINPPVWGGELVVNRDDTTYLLWMTVIFFVGALFPALVGPLLLRKRSSPPLQPHPREEAVPYTVMITVLVTLGTYYVLDNPADFGGAFLIAAILVLAPIGEAQTLRPTILRVLGTVLGSVFIFAIVSRAHSLTAVYLVGVVCIVIALMARLGPHAWIYYVFMLPATACLNSTSIAQVEPLGEQRVVDNVVGGVLVLAASALTIGYSRWASKHGHVSHEDPETVGLLDSREPAASATGSAG